MTKEKDKVSKKQVHPGHVVQIQNYWSVAGVEGHLLL